MSDINDAFWHKGQRGFVGSRAYSKAGFAKHGSHVNYLTTVALNYSVSSDGIMRQLAISSSIDADGMTASHANNPKKTITDDSSSSPRVVRQNASGATISAGKDAVIIVTIDKDGNLRSYMGEQVDNAETAVAPELDLTDECAFGHIYIANTTNAFVVGTTAHNATGVTATFSDLAFMPTN